MRFGVSTFVTDEGIAPSALGPALEERGFASLYLAEHTHVPVARTTAYPGGGDLPRQYYRTLDPFVALTAAGVVTERLELGTGIALVNQRDPILLAKETASLDLVTGGRAVLGVGAGWNREEMLHHGVDPKTRMARMREYVLAVKEIWDNDEAEFHGEFVDFDPIFSWPKPVQPAARPRRRLGPEDARPGGGVRGRLDARGRPRSRRRPRQGHRRPARPRRTARAGRRLRRPRRTGRGGAAHPGGRGRDPLLPADRSRPTRRSAASTGWPSSPERPHPRRAAGRSRRVVSAAALGSCCELSLGPRRRHRRRFLPWRGPRGDAAGRPRRAAGPATPARAALRAGPART